MWKRSLFAIGLALTFSLISMAQEQKDNALLTGIKVHGYWEISVFEPDGTLVSEVAFENALISPGTLTTLINGDAVAGGMYLVVTKQNVSSTAKPCNGDCIIAPVGMGVTSPTSTNLITSQIGTNFETLRLAGSVTATNTASIDLVQTWILLCGGAKTTANCRTSPDTENLFTSKTLTSAVNVTAGQIVQITVDLTFN